MRVDFDNAREVGDKNGNQVVYVYRIEGSANRIKIGHTTKHDYRARIAEQAHAGTSGLITVELICRTRDSATLERRLHRLMKPSRIPGAGAEWFAVPENLMEVIFCVV